MRLSFSQLSLYADCALQYRFKYEDKLPSDDASLPTEAGTAIHRAIEEYETRCYNQRRTGIDAPLPQLTELARHHLLANPATPDARHFGKQDLKHWYGAVENRCEAYLHSEVENFLDWGWWSFSPLSVEVELRTQFGGVDFVAFADQIRTDSNGIVVIRDIKTGKRKPDKHALQLNLYMLAFLEMNPDLSPDDVYGQVLYLGDKGVTADPVPLAMTKAGADALAAGLAASKDSGVFPPTGVFHDDACKWCPYKAECPLGALRQEGIGVLI